MRDFVSKYNVGVVTLESDVIKFGEMVVPNRKSYAVPQHPIVVSLFNSKNRSLGRQGHLQYGRRSSPSGDSRRRLHR